MKINLRIDIEKEFENYYNTINIKPHFGKDANSWSKGISNKIMESIKNKNKGEAYNNSMPFLKESYCNYSKYFEIFLKQVREYWDTIGPEFLKRLEKITGRSLPFEEITIYLTTIFRCPYNFKERWFMISFLNPPLFCIKTIAHELMHFNFIHYDWGRIEERIGKNKTDDLKEALTCLLNIEFQDLLFFKDEGYEKHRQLRSFIFKEWQKEKSYDKLLDKCIELLKNED